LNSAASPAWQVDPLLGSVSLLLELRALPAAQRPTSLCALGGGRAAAGGGSRDAGGGLLLLSGGSKGAIAAYSLGEGEAVLTQRKGAVAAYALGEGEAVPEGGRATTPEGTATIPEGATTTVPEGVPPTVPEGLPPTAPEGPPPPRRRLAFAVLADAHAAQAVMHMLGCGGAGERCAPARSPGPSRLQGWHSPRAQGPPLTTSWPATAEGGRSAAARRPRALRICAPEWVCTST